MKNKVLIKVYIPEFELNYDIFVPVNELVWKIKSLIIKAVCDLENYQIDENQDFILINKESGILYENNITISKTDIRNATELLMVSA